MTDKTHKSQPMIDAADHAAVIEFRRREGYTMAGAYHRIIVAGIRAIEAQARKNADYPLDTPKNPH